MQRAAGLAGGYALRPAFAVQGRLGKDQQRLPFSPYASSLLAVSHAALIYRRLRHVTCTYGRRNSATPTATDDMTGIPKHPSMPSRSTVLSADEDKKNPRPWQKNGAAWLLENLSTAPAMPPLTLRAQLPPRGRSLSSLDQRTFKHLSDQIEAPINAQVTSRDGSHSLKG